LDVIVSDCVLLSGLLADASPDFFEFPPELDAVVIPVSPFGLGVPGAFHFYYTLRDG
jgi:hypothetical protein